MTSVEAIQGWLSQVQATMEGLPGAFAAAAPRGDFATVLENAQAVLDGTAGASATASAPAAPGQGGAPTGASLTAALLPSTSPSPFATTPSAQGAATGGAAATLAQQYLGVPYLWGGASPAGFDCSGLVQYVYGQLGIALPRTSQEQALVGTPVASLAAAQPGDLVFYAGADGTPSAPGHVGIYLGNGQMIDAPYAGASVRIDPVGTPVAIRRVAPAAVTVGAPGAGATPSTLAPFFLASATRYGIPASLLTAVARVESNFNPAAVSSAGAQGLMQLMPATAASLGVDPFVPSQAIDGAARLLAGYLRTFGGSIPEAVAAYNAGAGAVVQYGGVPPYPQTQAYVQGVLQAMGATTTGVVA